MSGLLWRGISHQLLHAIGQSSGVRVFTSQALLEELTDVLTLPAASKQLAAIGKTACGHMLVAAYDKNRLH